jgi:regulatory protein
MWFLCYDYALQYLARYPKTSFELWKQLQKKWYEQEDISLTIEKLEMSWFLDDALYADMYLRSEVIRKWKPLFKVQQKLYQKWVDKDVVSWLLDEHEDELLTWQQEKIKKEIHRWRERGLEDQKIMQKLQSRWYGYRDIQSVYDMSEFS